MSPGRYSGDIGENHSLPASSQSKAETLDATVAGLADLDADQLRLQWRNHLGGTAPAHLPLAYRLQATCARRPRQGDCAFYSRPARRRDRFRRSPFEKRNPRTRDGIGLNPGALLVREWKGKLEKVMVLDKGFAWNGRTLAAFPRSPKL
jgi:Protein of unknown function (DUF2924)